MLRDCIELSTPGKLSCLLHAEKGLSWEGADNKGEGNTSKRMLRNIVRFAVTESSAGRPRYPVSSISHRNSTVTPPQPHRSLSVASRVQHASITGTSSQAEHRFPRTGRGSNGTSPAQQTLALSLLLGLAGALAALPAPAAPAGLQPPDVAQAENASPHYFGVTPSVLAKVRARLAAGDKALQPALKTLTDEADEALQVAPPSVTQKSKAPPSGDMHDYLSIAPYFWPDPALSNGLPYVRHDGRVNPESRGSASDHTRLGLMANTVETLALAYYLTGKDAYARQAAKFLRAWFLEPATRMNPHLEYAQGVPGLNAGRGTGIIEGRGIAEAADATGLLTGSPAWPRADQEALKTWLSTYLDKHYDHTEFAPILRQAALAYNEPGYEALLAKLPGASRQRLQLLFPQLPSATPNREPSYPNESKRKSDP